MSDSELAFMTLTDVAEAIAKGDCSSVEVTQHLLDRIERHDGKLGSYALVMAESALREARAADLAIARGEPLKPLHGVPVAVKDLCDATGVPTRAGMPRIRKDAPNAEADSTVVKRLRGAGAVLLGKLQLTEGAVAVHHPDIQVPLNPHNADYWSGASSSGSGAATVAGLCYGSLGSDTGGSIRFPSFANGATGLKQTWGRVSRAGVFPLSWSLDHVGPIMRSAADCAAMLGAIAGSDPDDPTALSVPVPDYQAELSQGVKGLRVGLDENFACTNVEPLVVAAMQDALKILDEAGADIVPVNFPDTSGVVDAWFPLCTAEAAAVHRDEFEKRASDFGPGLTSLVETGLATSGTEYALAHNLRQEFRGRVNRLFSGVDIVLAPAFMHQNPTVEAFSTFGERDTDWPELLRFTAPFDLSGTPTLSLPCGFNEDGAPYGFQLLAGNLNESLLTRAGHVYQQHTDFHCQQPKDYQ